MVFCPNCGTDNGEDDAFCWKCGSRLYKGETQDTANQEPVSEPIEESESKVKQEPHQEQSEDTVAEPDETSTDHKETEVEPEQSENELENEDLSEQKEQKLEQPKLDDEVIEAKDNNQKSTASHNNSKKSKTVAIAIGVVIIIVVAAIAVFALDRDNGDDGNDGPLSNLRTPDGTYSYDVSITYNGQTTNTTGTFTVENERYTYYRLGDQVYTQSMLDEANRLLEEAQNNDYTYREGPIWNNGSTELETYRISIGSNYQIVGTNGVVLSEYTNMDGMIIRTQLQGWEQGELPENPQTYTVRFTSGASTQTVEAGGLATEPTDPAVSDGYAFIGWRTSDGTLWDFENDRVNSNITLSPYSVQLMRANVDGNTVTVTMVGFAGSPWFLIWGDGLGQSGSSTSVSHTYESSGDYTLSITVTRGPGQDYYASIPITIDSSSITHTVSFYGNSATSQKVQHGDTADDPGLPTTLPDGHVFTGWETSSGSEWDFNTPVTSDITLRPTWTQLFTFTITNNHATLTQVGFMDYTIHISWGNDVGAGQSDVKSYDMYYTEIGSYDVTAYVTVDGTRQMAYAHPTVSYIPSCTISFYVDNILIKSDTVPSGSIYTMDDEPSKEGYAFHGWIINGSSPSETIGMSIHNWIITENIIAEALFVPHFTVEQNGRTVTVNIDAGWLRYTNTIDWGDGTSTVINVNSSSQLNATHTYSSDYSGRITVTSVHKELSYTDTTYRTVNATNLPGADGFDTSVLD